MDEQEQARATGAGAGLRWRRRGLVAGAATILAAVLARASERVAQATDGSPLIVAANNTATGQTVLNRSNSTAGTALEVDNNNGDAIYATALNGRGVYANTVNGTSAAMEANSSTVGITVIAGGHGVSSQTTATTASGAASLFGYSWGSVTPPNSTYAVRGDSMGYVGVRGNSGFSLGAMYPGAASIGVLGVSDPNDSRALATPAQPAGVYGLSNSSVAGVSASRTAATASTARPPATWACSAPPRRATASTARPPTATASTPPPPTAPASWRARTAASACRAPRTATWACWARPAPASAATSPPLRPRDSMPAGRPPATPHGSTGRCW